ADPGEREGVVLGVGRRLLLGHSSETRDRGGGRPTDPVRPGPGAAPRRHRVSMLTTTVPNTSARAAGPPAFAGRTAAAMMTPCPLPRNRRRLMPESDLRVNESEAIARLLRFLAVEGITGDEKTVGPQGVQGLTA